LYFCGELNTKIMNKVLAVGVSVLMFWLISCSSPQSKLEGTWKVKKVETNFDEQKVSPETLKQVVEMQKEMYFRFLNDSAMIIISNDNTHEAKWKFDKDDNTIYFYFPGMETSLTKLGVYLDNEIVAETNTPLGKITIIYEKQ